MILTGAGVSAESGIPTFRGAGGYWRKHDARTLATREAFERDPALVWEWYEERRATVRGATPNAAHRAIARLVDLSREHLVITQNVDDLHERGGTSADRLVHIHGEIFCTTCLECAFATSDPIPTGSPAEVPALPGAAAAGHRLVRREARPGADRARRGLLRARHLRFW